MNRTATAALGLTAALTLTGCGGTAPTYRPTAYGENGHCYYLNSPLEVDQLRRDGLCPGNWTPMAAPSPWLYRYGSYYYSPAYVSHYVPGPARNSTLSTGTTFLRDHKADVSAAQRDATYVTIKDGKPGKTVPASKIAKQVSSGKFGGGNARTTKQGGGTSRSGTCCKSHTTTHSTSHSSSHR